MRRLKLSLLSFLHWLRVRNGEKGQGLLEFALVIPLLLAVTLGIIEFGRLFATFALVSGAARSATRYGTAVGTNSGGTPYFLDCAGMRLAARSGAVALLNLKDTDIQIAYDRDNGAGGTSDFGNCYSPDAPPLSTAFLNGDRLRVQVTGTYSPILPLVNISSIPISFVSARTVIQFITGPPECNDQVENDGDGLTDYPADTGCDSQDDNSEQNAPVPTAECNDTVDNDGDGVADFPTDPGCSDAFDTDETSITVTFVSEYPLRKNTGSPKPIFVKALVVDEWGTPVTDATVNVTDPVTLAMSHNGAGIYGDGAGSCASGGDVTGGSVNVTVTAARYGESDTETANAGIYPGVCP